MVQLTRSQQQIRKAAQEFAKSEFKKGNFDKELGGDTALALQSIRVAAAHLGFISINPHEACQGDGLDLLDNTLVAEAFCRQDSTIGSALMLSTLGSETLARFGSKALKEEFLPSVAQGKTLSAMAFQEPGDPAPFSAAQTLARHAGDHWIITGEKSCVINGPLALFYCVLCRTDPDLASQGSSIESLGKSPPLSPGLSPGALSGDSPGKGLSLILVERERAGVRVLPGGKTLGLGSTQLARLSLEGVKVPISHLMGDPGEGMAYARTCLDQAWILMAAMALGIAQGALDRSLAYVRQRVQFGSPLCRFQVTRHKLADMACKIQLARLVTYQAAEEFGTKGQDPKGPAMAKLVSVRTAVEVADEAIQLLGGYGYMSEYEVERFFRDAKTLSLLLGSENTLKDALASDLIGKNR